MERRRVIVPRGRGTTLVLAFAAALAASPVPAATVDETDAQLNAPPAGLVPTAARLAGILSAHAHAVGTAPKSASDTVVEHWTFVDSGLAGTEDLQRAGTNYHSRIAAGPFVDEYGQYGETRWHQDANGFASLTTAIDTRTFYATRVLEDAADPKNDVTVLGETTGAHPDYVVKVKRPTDAHAEFIFYDKATAQVVRFEAVAGKQRIAETFDDFRRTGGVTRAWHIHDTNGHPELDDDWVLRSLRYGVPIPEETFQMPPNRPTVSRATSVVPLPAQTIWLASSFNVYWAGYLVRLSVGGRGLDFLLDSGSSRSIVDAGTARELGLPAYGQTTHLADGTAVPYRTTIPHASIGSITLDDFALYAESFAYQPDANTKIVGILGYDFFAANVLRFDFPNGTVEALPIAAFGEVHPVAGGIDVPLAVDDGTPLVSLGIGDAYTQRALLSTSMPFSIVLGSFVAAHPGDVPDTSRNGSKEQLLPLADAGTYGMKIVNWVAPVSHFRFAISDYQKVGLETTNAPIVVHDQPIDALLGADYLHYYDIYFDYPYGRLIVKPNALFYKTFKPAQSE